MPIDVFICHSALDNETANEVCVVLESDGFRCWIAPRDVPPGHEWAEAIVRGIDDSQVLLLILSQKAAASRQVLREVERAVRAGKEIVTFRIEDVTLSGSLDYFLAVHQWIDAFNCGSRKLRSDC